MTYTIHTDGGSRGNPGNAAVGVVIESETTVVCEISKSIGITTNNVAEYTALLEAVDWLSDQKLSNTDTISFVLDSLLVVQQLKGVYAVKNAALANLKTKVLSRLGILHVSYSFQHVLREQNKKADTLVNRALDKIH